MASTASNNIVWHEGGAERSANWHSEAGVAPPKRVVIADDSMKADHAYGLVCEGKALLWRGDFQNARQLLQALARRIDAGKKPSKKNTAQAPDTKTPVEKFHLYRMARAQRARTLGMLLIPFEADHSIPLRRAPDVKEACTEAYGQVTAPYVTSLRELLGLIGAHEWRLKGIALPVLGADARIHPHYGIFAPVRSEYVDLVAQAPLSETDLAFDIGTGTGVLAAVLAKRGIPRIVATESDARALDCAKDNVKQLGFESQIDVVGTSGAELFPPEAAGRAGLIVCNPPWLPGKPGSPLEHAIYDQDSRMLKGFLAGLAARLAPGGEGWLILSDFAEHLGLRTRDELLGWITAGGLQILDRMDVKPHHPKVLDTGDQLHTARQNETTSLWRLNAT